MKFSEFCFVRMLHHQDFHSIKVILEYFLGWNERFNLLNENDRSQDKYLKQNKDLDYK